jgi:hypothetical protein
MRTAIYRYRSIDYKGVLIPHATKVEIIGESDKSYLVRYLEPGARKQPVGSLKWVRKRNIIESAGSEVRTASCGY